MNYQKYFWIAFLAASIFIYQAYYPAKHSMCLIFLDVGQGDSSLIILPDGRKILVDGGPDDQVLAGLGRYLNFFDRRIDFVVLSHEHDDHVFGLVQVLKRYQVGEIIEAADNCQNASCREFFAVAKEKGIGTEKIISSQRLVFANNCLADFFPPGNPQAKNINDRSLVLHLDCAGAKILLAGDSEAAREKELLESGEDLSATVFKASHHGSDTSNSEEFLKAVNPQLVVISVGAGNSFGHPSPGVLARLKRLGIRFFRTDINGNISLYFEGTTYPQVSIDKVNSP